MFRQTKEKDEKGGDTRLLLILPAFRERGTNLTEYRSFVMQLADKKIRIKPLYDMIREYCKEYIIPDSYANLARHVLLFKGDIPVATCRFFFSEERVCYVIGRIVVSKEFRGKLRLSGSEIVNSSQ